MKIAVYGLGNFGYAITKHLADHAPKEYEIFAFDRNEKVVKSFTENGRHPFLHKEHSLNGRTRVVTSSSQLVEDAEILVLAVPSYAIAEVLKNVKNGLRDNVILVNTAKALDNTTGKPLSKTVEGVMKGKKYRYAMMAGGTIASDLFEKQPLGIDIASKDGEVRKQLSEIFTSDNLAVYTLDDVIGVELAGAFKNVAAILAGIMFGRGFSYGSETHIISLAAYELENLAVEMGAKRSTFLVNRQCWGNDLLMSCTGKTRNREFGILLGKGVSATEALKIMEIANKTVEGVNTVKMMGKILKDGEYPVLHCLYDIIENNQYIEELTRVIFRSKTK